MEGIAKITLGLNKHVTYNLHPLEVAELVASRHGFFDLDVDQGPNGIKIVATSKGRTLTVNGKTTAQAVESLVGILHG